MEKTTKYSISRRSLENTNIQRTVMLVDENPMLDHAVRLLLADPQILARILKRVTVEFRDEEIGSIMRAIEGKPEIAGPLYGGTIPPEARIIPSDDKESNIPGEGKHFFDVKFSARIAENRIVDFGIRILVDVEAQYDYYPGYDIVTRGLFYGGRMLSEQSGVEFVSDDYDNLRKVYSIWICMNPPKYARNSIVKFGMKPEILYGNFPNEKLEKMKYDLLDVVLVFISSEGNQEKDELCGMLEVALDEHIDKEEKLRRLEVEYGLKRTYELESEVGGMCDYSTGIAMKHFRKGVDEGVEQARIEAIINMIELGLEDEQIRMKYSEEELERAKGILLEKKGEKE